MLKQIIITSAFLCAGTPALAKDWSTAGGWDVGETPDGTTCFMSSDYEGEGETLVMLGVDIDDQVILSVSNYNWSAQDGQEYELFYVLNKQVFGGKSRGAKVRLRKGFVAKFAPEFLKHFAASPDLEIYNADRELVDDLSLDGSAAGLTQLRRCVGHLKSVAAAEAREKERLAHIPKDPFAKASASPTPVDTAAAPRTPFNNLVSMDDYPAAALRAEEEGTVEFKLTIGEAGRVEACTIVASSGSAALDAATCRILQSRARFAPAKSASGNATQGEYQSRIVWSLP